MIISKQTIERVLEQDGVYVGASNTEPGEAVFCVKDGKIFSMKIDTQLDPNKFINGHFIYGPFRAKNVEKFIDV